MSRLTNYLSTRRQIRALYRSVPDVDHIGHHFSQYGEDIILRGYFPRNYKGFYVDVGALHPYRFSNTALFHRLGWQGINIEPSAEGYRALNEARREDINLCVAVGSQEGTCTYEMFDEPAFNRLKTTSLHLEETALGPRPTREVTVPVAPLATILSKHLPTGTVIDFLTVDCEGVDLDVLRSNDWNQYIPRLVCVEDWKPIVDSEIVLFLSKQGYEHVGQTHNTRILRHESFRDREVA